jgi:predicted restriction endonuclease
VSTNKERLDGNNGLLLAPHVDHLFDRGFIAFSEKGKLLVSPQLPSGLLKAWSLPANGTFGAFNKAQRKYLAYHRDNVFRAA